MGVSGGPILMVMEVEGREEKASSSVRSSPRKKIKAARVAAKLFDRPEEGLAFVPGDAGADLPDLMAGGQEETVAVRGRGLLHDPGDVGMVFGRDVAVVDAGRQTLRLDQGAGQARRDVRAVPP